MPSINESPTLTRRSSRLRNRVTTSDAESTVSTHRQKRRQVDTSGPHGSISTTPNTPSSSTGSRRLRRITHEELDRREKSLLNKEKELIARSDELEKRAISLTRKEDEASIMTLRIAEQEADTTLRQLEEHFVCALCYEVLAAPYTLNPGHCGHTFCALCILKWFFSRLHRACGGWHESVDCPICRSLLIITPDGAVRGFITFPFVPNRLAAATIESLVEKLLKLPVCPQAKIKKEETEGIWASQSRKDRGSECARKEEQSDDKEPDKISDALDVTLWGEGGHMRAEWLKRDREGKKEMNHLLKCWCTMGSQEFIALKERLGV